MMQVEFERIAGYEVYTEDYNNVIEPMYMATNLSKEDFAKVIDRNRFEVKKEKTEEQINLEAQINEEIRTLKNDIEWYMDRICYYSTFINDDDGSYWKEQVKEMKQNVKLLKNRISALKWVLK